ncbi:MAG: glycosyltransferase [Candidatus Staskawiczbacteria bacterium]|jgi:glycosyltransferase involved in cell wall biosynthesis
MIKKKIMFLLPNFYQAGGHRVVSELSLNLPENIGQTLVLFENKVSFPFKGNLISLDIPLSNNFIFRAFYFLVALARFKKIVKREKPDYIMGFGVPANIINILSNKKSILRVDTFLSSSNGNLYKILARNLFHRAPQVICVSKRAAKDLVENFNIEEGKIKVIYNPLDINKIRALAKGPLTTDQEKIFGKPVIISTGRLVEGKNFVLLIKVFKKVKEKIKDAQLVILGEGEMMPELEKVISDLNLKGEVHLLGWQENPFKFLSKAKLFVLASLQEGLPYCLLEAMACGIPVISTDCKSGPREILAPQTDVEMEAQDIEYAEFGILTPVSNEGVLGNAIISVLTDATLERNLAEKSRERAEDFDVKKIIKKWDFLGY